MITTTHQLLPADLNALEGLLGACRKADQATLPVYPHLLETYRPGPASILYYKENQLIGFIALFYFYEDAAEVALMTHPTFRRQGVARKLWGIMYENTQSYLMTLNDVIIPTPNHLNPPWFNPSTFQFTSTEYDMYCTPYLPDTQAASQTNYRIRVATTEDIKALHTIDKACFNPNRPEPIQRIEKLLATPNTKIFLMFDHKQLIGQVHLVFEAQQVRLTDLAVLPRMQRQGFGQALLCHCLKYAYEHQQKKISLTVIADNQSALHLYQNAGFQIYNAVDYYKHRFSLDIF